MSRLSRSAFNVAFVGVTAVFAGCSWVPNSGPSTAQVERAGSSPSSESSLATGIQIVDLNADVARKLYAERSGSDFLTTLGGGGVFQQQLGVGDTIEISIWGTYP